MTAQPPPPPSPPPSTDEAPPPGGPGVAQFFDRIRRYGAVRPDDGRWFAGVAAGLARRWGIDPLLVRGGFVILAIFGGIGFLLYGLGWLFLPHPDGRIHAQEVLRGVVTPGFIGGLLFVLADLGTSGWGRGGWYGPHPFGGGLLLVGLVVLGVWWFAGGRHRRWSGGPGHGGPGSWGGPRGPEGPAGPGGPGSGWQGGGWQGGGSWHGGRGHGGGWRGGPGGPEQPGGPAPAPGGAPEPGPRPGADEPGAGARGEDVPPYGTPPTPPAPPTPPTASGSGWPAATWSAGPETYGSGAPAAVLAPPAPPTPPAWLRRPDPHRPSHALTGIVAGLALLAAALVGALGLVAGGHSVVAVAAGVALAVVALGVIVTGVAGRRAGGLAPLGILLAIVTIGASATTGPVSWAGDRTWRPTGTATYQLGAGNARLELRQATAAGATSTSPAEVDARVGVGNLVVVVPAGMAVRVIANTGVGNIERDPALTVTPDGTGTASPTRRGPHAELDVRTAADPVVVVRADVGVGTISIDGATGQEQ